MSAKNLDQHYRWRNRTVAFRVSEAENMLIDTFAKLCKMDPAMMTGPLMSTVVDAVSLLIYFAIASSVLNL